MLGKSWKYFNKSRMTLSTYAASLGDTGKQIPFYSGVGPKLTWKCGNPLWQVSVMVGSGISVARGVGKGGGEFGVWENGLSLFPGRWTNGILFLPWCWLLPTLGESSRSNLGVKECYKAGWHTTFLACAFLAVWWCSRYPHPKGNAYRDLWGFLILSFPTTEQEVAQTGCGVGKIWVRLFNPFKH